MRKSTRNPHLTLRQKDVIQKHMLRPAAWKVLSETNNSLMIESIYHKNCIKVLDKSRDIWEEQGALQNAS